MPRVKDLAINTIPSNEQKKGYWMCQKSTITPPLTPTCDKDKPKPKNAGALPHDAVVQLRQQLQQQIRG